MIQTILLEKNKMPLVTPVECIRLPGPRKIILARGLQKRYGDFTHKLDYLLRYFGYKNYLQKFFVSLPEYKSTVENPLLELPLLLSVLQELKIIKPGEIFALGTINTTLFTTTIDENIVQVLSLLELPRFSRMIVPLKPLPLQLLIKHEIGNKMEITKTTFEKSKANTLLLSSTFEVPEFISGLDNPVKIFYEELYPNIFLPSVSGKFFVDGNNTAPKNMSTVPTSIKEQTSILYSLDTLREIDMDKLNGASFGEIIFFTKGCMCGKRIFQHKCECSYAERKKYVEIMSSIKPIITKRYISRDSLYSPLKEEEMQRLLLTL